jgi:hypothetical protein
MFLKFDNKRCLCGRWIEVEVYITSSTTTTTTTKVVIIISSLE